MKLINKHQGKENRKYSLDDYNGVISLRKQGFSYEYIAKKINISNVTAQLWFKTERKPRFLYAQKQQKVLNKYAYILSNDLAYIYGVLIGDGYLENSKLAKRIGLQVVDKEFADKFFIILQRWSGFKPSQTKRKVVSKGHKTRYGNIIIPKHPRYSIRLGSVQAINFLSNKLKCKTYIWRIPDDIKNTSNNEIIFSFLKGIFDSEGFPIYMSKYKKGRIELEMFGVGVLELQQLLRKINIECTVIQGKKQKERGMYILRILRKDSIRLYAKDIGFVIERKNRILNKILIEYNKKDTNKL